MNGNNHSNNSMCNQNQIPKNLPLKKRRAYIIDTPTNRQDENQSTTMKQSYSHEDPLQIHLPPSVVPTPPSSPHIEFLRQHYAYILANDQHQHLFAPSTAEWLMAQKVLDDYRTFMEQQYQNQPCGYTLIEDKQKRTDVTIDEHFRKSLGENYDKSTRGFLTPDDSSSNSSPIDQTPVDSIEEHFARSLGKFWPIKPPSNEENTSSVVDDHFAKALGATTWEKLKEKS